MKVNVHLHWNLLTVGVHTLTVISNNWLEVWLLPPIPNPPERSTPLHLRVILIGAMWLIAARAYPSFCSMKWLGVFPPGRNASPSQVTPPQSVRFPPQFARRERGTVRVKCLDQEYITMSLARAWTRSILSTLRTKGLHVYSYYWYLKCIFNLWYPKCIFSVEFIQPGRSLLKI